MKSLSQFLDAVQDNNLIPFLENHFKEKSLLTITPTMDIVVPLLYEAYKEREALLVKNRNFLSDKQTDQGKR